MAMIYERTATGELVVKRVAAYLKSSHKENPIRVERCPDGTFFLADGYVAVSVPAHPDLFPYTHIEASWQYASFWPQKEASKGGPDIAALWRNVEQEANRPLTLTPYLWEIPGLRNKPGTLYRRFLDGEREVYVSKKICDLFSPDLDELAGFQFAQAGNGKPIRVEARSGMVAIVMPHIKNS